MLQSSPDFNPARTGTVDEPVVKLSREARARKRRISEITQYLISNNGPDEAQRAHPNSNKILVDELSEALAIARDAGISGDWKPWHFKGHYGTFSEPEYVNQLLVKKVNSLLVSKYNNDIGALIREVTQKELLSPIVETVAGRTIETRVTGMAYTFNFSPYHRLSGIWKLPAGRNSLRVLSHGICEELERGHTQSTASPLIL